MSKVVLINPRSPFLLDQGVHGPLGLWYIGAMAKRVGHEVLYADLGLGDQIPSADVYGITGTSPQHVQIAEAMWDASTANRYVSTIPTIVLGGPHATVSGGDDVTRAADIVVRGEGEVKVIEGLFDKKTGLRQSITVDAPRIENLDDLPFPDRSQARRYKYHITDKQGNKRLATTLISSRGCPNQCSFCSTSIWKRRYKQRSAANVLAEIGELVEKHDWTALHFYDDSMCIDKRRLMEICLGMERWDLAWRCFARADQLNEDMLAAMARAGCVEIGMGVESGSQTVLDKINKGETVGQMVAAIKWAHKAGIRVKTFLIVGLPGESWETIDETMQFLRDAQPDDVDWTVLQIYPGSPIHKDPHSFGIDPHSDYTWYKGRKGEYQCSHSTEHMTPDDILVARDYLEARFKKA